jgi:hypothetical protein
MKKGRYKDRLKGMVKEWKGERRKRERGKDWKDRKKMKLDSGQMKGQNKERGREKINEARGEGR